VLGPAAYDAVGRLKSIPGILNDVTYDAAGRPRQQTNANGTVTSFTYSPERAFLKRIETTAPGGLLQSLDYEYDDVGLLKQVTSPVQIEGWSYFYDDLYRVTSAVNHTNPGESQTFQYDSIGRLIFNSRVGTYAYPGVGQPRPHAPLSVNGSPMAYDANGNLTSGANRTPVWDVENRIAQIGQAQFTYDGTSERIKKVSPGVTSRYPFGDDYEITNGMITKYVPVAGLGLVAKRTGSGPGAQTFWLHSDRQGSIQAVTNSTGGTVFRRTYRPFGETLGQSGALAESRGWIGQRNDTETGLTYLHARYLDPKLGLFLSPDPAGASLNSYLYASGDPVNWSDPSGLIMENDGDRSSKIMAGSSPTGGSWNIFMNPDRPVSKDDDGLRNAAIGGGGVGLGLLLDKLINGIAGGGQNQRAAPSGGAPGVPSPRLPTPAPPKLVGIVPVLLAPPAVNSPVPTPSAPGTQWTPGSAIEAIFSARPNIQRPEWPEPPSDTPPWLARLYHFGQKIPQAEEVLVDNVDVLTMLVIVRGGVTSPVRGPYARPSGATTAAQRIAVQGQPCALCGTPGPRMNAGHRYPLVEEYYRTGTIDVSRMRALDAVRPECPYCSNAEGSFMARFSRDMKKFLGF
jgi:RHS repeat-associated protein